MIDMNIFAMKYSNKERKRSEKKEQAIFLEPSVACANNKHRTRKNESNFNQFLPESNEIDLKNIVS